MATKDGPQPIVTNGLIFYIDPGNTRSHTSGSSDITSMDNYNGYTGSFQSTDVIYSNDGNGSLLFDGTTGDAVHFPSFQTIGLPAQNLTWQGWAKAVTQGSYDTIVSTAGSSPSTDGGAIYWRDHFGTSKYYADFNFGAGSTRKYPEAANGATSLNLVEEWNEITWTYNGSNTIIYLNGVLGESEAVTGDINDLDEIKSLGGDATAMGTSHMWDGNITCVRMYNRALTQAEITQNYNALKSRFGK